MARARNIKPGFYRDAALVELPVETRLLFPGLWIIADRAGRLEDKPKQIKMEIYPADSFDVESMLCQLAGAGLIIRYEAEGKRYIQIRNFCKHQNPHRDEKSSTIPAPCQHGANTVHESGMYGVNPADSLIPDSLSLDSLIPDSPIPGKVKSPAPAKPSRPKNEPDTELQSLCKAVWHAYSLAYQDRYGAAPIRNAKINSNVKGFCLRIPAADSPHVAAWYVGHNGQRYVAGGHVFGLLLADAEKLRTEWATNRKITNSQSRLADQTEGRGQVWGALIAEAEERERNGSEQAAA